MPSIQSRFTDLWRADSQRTLIPGRLAMPKVALITEVIGQDGAYLAEFLLNAGYDVHGIKRRSSLFNTQRIDHLYEH